MKPALTEETRNVFDFIAGILLRCFIFMVVAQLFTWLVLLLAGDAIYQVYSALFDISRRQYDLFILSSMIFMKVLNVVFFLMPFAAIKLMLRVRHDDPRR